MYENTLKKSYEGIIKKKKALSRKFMILSIEHKIAIKDTITPARLKSQKEKRKRAKFNGEKARHQKRATHIGREGHQLPLS